MTNRYLLDSISIASPCSADWDAMQGDQKTRHCQQCRLSVHDLSAMTTDEAMALLRDAGSGRLCVRFHRRQDGTVLTQDCPVGLRRKLRAAWARAAAMLLAIWGGAVGCVRQNAPQPQVKPPLERLQGEVVAPLMGDVAVPEALMGKVKAPAPGERR